MELHREPFGPTHGVQLALDMVGWCTRHFKALKAIAICDLQVMVQTPGPPLHPIMTS